MHNRLTATQTGHRPVWVWLLLIGSLLFSILPTSLPTTQIAEAQAVACGGNFPASADATIDLDLPDTNTGAVPTLDVSYSKQPKQISMLRFNLKNALPTGASVQQAVLILSTPGLDASYNLAVSGIDGAWDESTVTWNNHPAQGADYAAGSYTAASHELRIDVTNAALHWATRSELATELMLAMTDNQDLQAYSKEGQIAPRLEISCALPVQDNPDDQQSTDAKQLAAIKRLE